MLYKIKLKNVDKEVILDEKGYNEVMRNEYLKALNFHKHLRQHSAGYAVFQRSITTKKGVVFETIYLHKHLAEKFVKKPKSDMRLFVMFDNGNVLDCRLENLKWVTMSDLRLQTVERKMKEKEKAAKAAAKKSPAKKKAAKKK